MEKKEEIRIKPACNMLRSYTLNDGGIYEQVENLIFYSDGKVNYESRGWIEYDLDGTHNYLKDLDGLDIAKPKKANKVNLDRTDNFFIRTTTKYSKGIDLYLFSRDLITFDKEIMCLETETDRHYIDRYKLNLVNEGLPQKYLYSKYFTRLERTETGLKVDAIKAVMDKNNSKIGSYEIEKLLEYFEIVPKKGKQ
jgi:hypothetical protein